MLEPSGRANYGEETSLEETVFNLVVPSWGTGTANATKNQGPLRDTGLSNFLFLKPGASQNIALLASSAT